jgi:hypothetical protein
MKNILIAFLMFLGNISNAQTTDEKIIAVFGEEQFAEMKANNPGFYKYNVGMVEKGIVVFIRDDNKYLEYPEIATIPLRSKTNESISIGAFLTDFYNISTFNALIYGFSPSEKDQIFRLAGTNQAILVRSQKDFYKN